MNHNILFIGAFTTDSFLNMVGYKFESLYSVSQYIIRGLRKKTNINLSVVNSPDIPSYPQGPFFIRSFYDAQENIRFVSSLNVSLIKQVWTIAMMVFHAAKIILKNSGPTIVLIPYMVFRHVITTRILKTLFSSKVKICIIIPDVFFPSKKHKLLFYTNSITERLARKSDFLVLYTKAIAEYLGIKEKPFIVMEGIVDYETMPEKTKPNRLSTNVIVTYAGSLHKKYGIMRLLDSMKYIDHPNFELHLLGKGDAVEVIKHYSISDQRIKFLGLLSKNEAMDVQFNSTILINPRSAADGEYTQYSFPSKNLEYLLSGKPTILARLPGMPEDYYPYFIDAGDCSPQSLASAIEQVLRMTQQERNQFGAKAQQFIIENKNYEIQTERILNLFRN